MSDRPPSDSESAGRRPPKRGEPWPRRFTFTPDGGMRFEKADAARPPRPGGPRRPYPSRPGSRPGPDRPPGRFGPGRPGSGRPSFQQGPERPFRDDRDRPPFREGPRPRSGHPFSDGGGAPRPGPRGPREGRPFPRSGGPRGEAPDAGPRVRNGGPYRDFRGPRPGGPDRRPDRPGGGFRGERSWDGEASSRGPRPRPGGPRFDRSPRVFDSSGPRSARKPMVRPPRESVPPLGSDIPSAPQVEGEGMATRMELVERILSKATPTIPADLLLRQTLARRKQLSRGDGAWVSRAVFSWFRWKPWLDAATPLPAQVDQALALADDFAIKPTQPREGSLD